MTSMDNPLEHVSDAVHHTVVIAWASPRRGMYSVGRALGGLLSSKPHYLDTVEIDLYAQSSGQSLLHAFSSWTGLRVDAAALAARGWPVLEQSLSGRDPRVVVALDPMAAAALIRWREERRFRAPVVGVSLGMRLDPGWARVKPDRLSVADEIQGNAALKQGLPPECVVPSGVPVCGGFSSVAPDDKAPLRRRFGLPEDRPVVLVVTDGLEHELTGVLFQLGLVAERATLMFDVARDDDSADLLRRRAGIYGVEARMFGKVEQAGELWASADLVIARPHLYVEQRAIALRLPFIHLLPDGEVEQETARVYAEREIGAVVEHVSTLSAEVELQLAPATLAATRERIGRISRRSAAGDIARLVAQVTASADQVLAEARGQSGRQQADQPAVTSSATPSRPHERRGPLETIGAAPAEPLADGGELLADLEAAEAEANRQVSKHQRDVELWTRRAALAEQRHEPELAQEARRIVESSMASMHRALAELGRLTETRQRLEHQEQQRKGVERDFQRLEVEDALAALKRKMGQDA